MSILLGLLAGGIAGIAGALLSLARLRTSRSDSDAAAAVAAFILDFLLIFIEDGAIHSRPEMTFAGLAILILVNAATLLVVAAIADGIAGSLSAATAVSLIATLALGIICIAGYNSGHGDTAPCPAGANQKTCSKAAYGIVHVDLAPSGTLPASTTSNLVVVTGDEAATKASQAMSSGIAATRNFSSYLDLGPATLQMIAGHMWYAFPLEFQGAINKQRLHSVNPGYILISAEDPNAAPVERYDGSYSMIVSLGGGQGSEPDRWARSHGYDSYLLDNPTLEIADNGDPYYTVTLLSPQIGWTFQAPVGVLLINAHTGQITRYNLPGRGLPNPAPSWIDRIYSENSADQIANWFGFYGQAPFGGQGNSNRYQVSGDPVMVYTGDGNPSWRMLLTSFGSETSVYRIIEMDAATGAISVYTPAGPMGIETSVAAAFCNAQGIGATNVRANHLIPEDMTLHVIDGQLTWMVSYESEGSESSDNAPDQQEGDSADPCGSGLAPVSNPTFTGVGFVSAYQVSANNVAYGSTRSAALQNYLQQLASQGNANGNAPGAGATQLTVTGTICAKNSDISGGNETYYITMCKNGKPDSTVVYTGTSTVSPALVLAVAGDHVIIQVEKVTATNPDQQMLSFSDAQHPLAAAGS